MTVPKPTKPTKVFVYNMMNGDEAFCKLVLSVSNGREYTKWQWAKCTLCEEVPFGERLKDHSLFGMFMVCDTNGYATNMPNYLAYDRTWKDAKRLNPFEVDWLNYNCCDPVTSQYVADTLDVLEEQIDLWRGDDGTRECLPFMCFVEFTNRLRRLYEYGVSVCEFGAPDNKGVINKSILL